MKKIFATALTMCAMGILACGAQSLSMSPAVQILMPSQAYNPILSPDGQKVLYSTTTNHHGLNLMEISTGRITQIDEASGAGFQPVFDKESHNIIYSTAAKVDGLVNHDIRRYDCATGDIEVVAPMSRNDIATQAVANPTYANADWDHIDVCIKGETKRLNPIADAHSYLWASISPDGNRLMFCEPFSGVYVSDIDGTNAVKIAAKGDFPSWISPEWVVYVVSHDDGYVILDSKLVAMNVTTGEKIDLTDDKTIVGEVSTSDNGRLIYSTVDGRLFLTTITPNN